MITDELDGVKAGDKLIVEGIYIQLVTRTTATRVYVGDTWFNRGGRRSHKDSWDSIVWAKKATPERIAEAERRKTERDRKWRRKINIRRIQNTQYRFYDQMTDEELAVIIEILDKYNVEEEE